uniref:Signal peptide peptidase-like 2B n=1 Tax=Hirondellea gigas TaxID=1518452 RepID=A0A2P2HY25_9CRUS
MTCSLWKVPSVAIILVCVHMSACAEVKTEVQPTSTVSGATFTTVLPSQKNESNDVEEHVLPSTNAAPTDPIITVSDDDQVIEQEEEVLYQAYYGIMVVRQRSPNSAADAPSTITRKICTSFYPEITDMAENETTALFQPVVDLTEWIPCSSRPPVEFRPGQLAILDGRDNNGTCPLLDASAVVQRYGGMGSIFVRDKRPPFQSTTNTSLWLTFVSNASYQYLVSVDPELVDVAVYSPKEDFALNYSLIVIWLLAVCTVTVGSFWSGQVRYRLYTEASLSRQKPSEDSTNGVGTYKAEDSDEELNGAGDEETGGRNGSKTPVYPREETSLQITPRVTLFFVLLMCVMLVSLYFLYQYLVYMIIALFCIASVGALYGCFEPLVMRLPCGTCRTPYFNLGVISGQLEVRHLLLLAFAFSVTITWLVLRNEPYAWLLQDALGVAFCINMLRTIRLPNLKICTVLLAGLFVYDIFFVFVTPLFTADNKSIMVEVAQGGGPDGEQLPMVFKVPHFTYSEVISVCNLRNNYNLLGFGDVLVPGLLVSYVYSYDLQTGRGKCPLYFIVNVIAYGIGLCLTFAGLYLMRGAQPALLYLVPCTLLPTVIIAAIREDLADMWRGDPPQEEVEPSSKAEEDSVSHVVHEQNETPSLS